MNKPSWLIVALTLVLGIGAGYWWAQQRGVPREAAMPPSSAERKPLYYRHPMNPATTSPVPKKDEMGMDYVPVYEEKESGPAGTVSIDPVTVQNIGVRTARAELRALGHTLRAVGRVDYDEAHLARLNPKTEGWVEELRVSNTGEQVEKGAILLSLYSPQLVAAQQEYLLALQNLATLKDSPYPDLRRGAEHLVEAARARLEFFDVPAHQIHELEQSGQPSKYLHIHSPFDGVLVNVGVRPGQYVTPDTELYRIADLRTVWVYVDVYENELLWVRTGDVAEMSVTSAPGQAFRGKVMYIYPFVDPKTRTARLRLEFDNRSGWLKPEMFTEVTLRTGRTFEVTAVPAEAVIRSGAREQVFVVRAPGKYEPREVVVGNTTDGWTEIRQGVKAGEEVLISAQFLIDSESKLREAATKMREPSAPPAVDLDMSGMALEPPTVQNKAGQQPGAEAHRHD